MLKEINIGDTSVNLFDKLIHGSYPVSSITGVTYHLTEHGLPSRNMPLQHDIQHRFGAHESPLNIPLLIKKLGLERGEVFAIGSLVEISQKRSPMSFIMMDFDCQKEEKVKKEIMSILKLHCRNSSLSLVASDFSYHLVFDDFVHPANLVWHLGKLMEIFSVAELDNKRASAREYALALQKHYRSIEAVRKISNEALNSFGHEDEFTDKRWVSHSVLELTNYLMRNREVGQDYPYSFAFIRLTPKKDIEPTVVGRQRVGGILKRG